MAFKTSVIIDLTGNLQRNAQRYGQAIGRFSQTGQRHLRRLSTVANSTGRMLDRMGNRYTALLTGAAGVGTGKAVINDQRRFTRLGIQANKSAEEIAALKQLIYETAEAPDIRIDPSQITSAIEAIVEKTGDLQFAQENIRNVGLAIQATGAEGGAIGEILAEFQKMGVKAPAEVMKALDTLNVQGKEGAFTLQNLAALGPRVVTAYTSLGRTGVPALREMGAALQVIRQGTGSSEMAATAFEALLRTLGDKKKVKALQKGGIQVFDPEALKRGQEVLRPINELMAEIIQKTGGKKTVLSGVFDAEAIRAFNAAASEFQRTGQMESLQKFMSVQADGSTTIKDSARAAHDAAGAIQSLKTAWDKFADESLTGPLQSAADILNSISSETTGKIIKGLVIGGAGALAIGKAYKFGSWAMGKRGGAACAAGGGLGGMPLPLPVYVVNSQMSLTPDAWNNSPGGKSKGGRIPRAGGKWAGMFGKFGSKAALPLTLATAGYDLYSTWSDSNKSTEQKAIETGGVAGGTAGALALGKLGAVLGTAIAPGIGTAIGGLLGAGAGYLGGEALAESLGSKIAQLMGNEREKEVKVTMELESKDGSKATVKRMRGRGARVDVDSALQVGSR